MANTLVVTDRLCCHGWMVTARQAFDGGECPQRLTGAVMTPRRVKDRRVISMTVEGHLSPVAVTN